MMKVKHITIIGIGLIGGSLGLAIKAACGQKVRIAAMDRDCMAAQQAVEIGAADEVISCKELAQTDVVFICTPVLQIPGMVETIIPYLKPGTIITDVGSTKEFIAQCIHKILPSGLEYISGHPMAGREQSGILAANKDLFRDKWYIFIPEVSTSWGAMEIIRQIVELTGAKTTVMDVGSHDACAAVISHVPHVVAAALVNLLELNPDPEASLKLAGGGFRDTTRIASSNADMWSDICLTNKTAITKNLSQLQVLLGQVIQAIEQEDRQELYNFFARAKLRRDSLLTRSETII